MNIQSLANSLKPFQIKLDITKTGRIEKLIFSIDQGFLMASQSSSKGGFQVDYISIHKEHQRQGHATSLFKAVKNALKAQGVVLHHSTSKTCDGSKWHASLYN